MQYAILLIVVILTDTHRQ